jgi:hypothetical protein
LSNNLLFPPCTAVVQQIPLNLPVFIREKSSKLYRIFPYYFGRYLSNIVVQCFYPTLLTMLIYFSVKIKLNIFTFLYFLADVLLLNLTGLSLGYMCGCLYLDPMNAFILANVIYMFFWCGAGGFINIPSMPLWIKIISYITPSRYSIEIILRLIMWDAPYSDKYLEELGYTMGLPLSFLMMFVILTVYVFIGYFVLYIKFKKV